MIKYEASVLNQFDSESSGNAFVDVSVTVRKSLTGEKATLYSDDGITEIENPTKTNNLGDYVFYIPQGEYSIILDEGGEFQKKLERVFIGSGSGLTVNTETELLKSSNPIGDVIKLAQIGNPTYLVSPVGTPMQEGDKKTDSGTVLVLQPDEQGAFDVRWFSAKSGQSNQRNAFNRAANRAKDYASSKSSGNTRGVVRVPAGVWNLGSATSREATWLVDSGAEFSTPANFPGSNTDNIEYLSGNVIKVSGRGIGLMHVGSSDLQWLQDIRDSILGTSCLQVVSKDGTPAILGATRKSDNPGQGEGTIGIKSYVLNDGVGAGNVGVAYGMYKEAIRAPGAGSTFGEESNVTTYGTMVPVYPNQDIGGASGVGVNLWVGGPAGNGPYDGEAPKTMSSCAMVVTPGLAEETPGVRLGFDAGIVFLARSFETSPQKEVTRQFSGAKYAWYDSSGNRKAWLRGNEEGGSGVFRFTVDNFSGTDREVTITPLSLSGTDNQMQLGNASARWTEVFAANGAINTSDEREKQQVRGLSETEKAVAMQIKGMVKGFKWNHAVDEKGDSARWHFGVMAQQVAQAFTDNGLDPENYGLFCYDEWEDNEESGVTAGNRYGVRYNELIMFILGAL